MSEVVFVYEAEIGEGITFSGRTVAVLTIFRRKQFSTARGKKLGSLVADSTLDLLDDARSLFEQEGSWEAVAEKISRTFVRES